MLCGLWYLNSVSIKCYGKFLYVVCCSYWKINPFSRIASVRYMVWYIRVNPVEDFRIWHCVSGWEFSCLNRWRRGYYYSFETSGTRLEVTRYYLRIWYNMAVVVSILCCLWRWWRLSLLEGASCRVIQYLCGSCITQGTNPACCSCDPWL
jgi:hypothetical protein